MIFVRRNLFWILGGLASVVMVVASLLFATSAKSKADENLRALSAYTNSVNQLKDATPYPSPETIAKVDEDTVSVEDFSRQAEALFDHPKPPVMPPRQFKVHLINSLVALQAEATHHNVRLPPEFRFTFAHLLPKPNLLPYSVGPLGERLQDIQHLSKILFESRVHSIDSFARVPAHEREKGGRVLLYDVGIRTNLTTETAEFTSTPYRFTFRGFTSELTEVLNRLANSDRFYVVRQIEVQAMQSADSWQAVGKAPNDFADNATLKTTRVNLLRQAHIAAAAQGVVRQTLETIVDERLLRVTLMVDVVKRIPTAG